MASVLYDAILNGSLVTLPWVLQLFAQLITLRDVFYRDVGLFKHQRVVDSVGCLFASADNSDRR